MGRPREHGDATRQALLDAAERLIAEGGPEALSVRAVADAVDTTTRAVYSVFGSKDGLLAALAQRVFEMLGDNLVQQPATDDPAGDLVEAAIDVYRAMALDNPAAYRVTFLRVVPDLDLGSGTVAAAQHSLQLLHQRFERLDAAGGLNGRTVLEATRQFHAMCEGLATIELRNPAVLGDDPEQAWRDSISTLLNGLATPPTSLGGRVISRRVTSRRSRS
jgi:AcrR family transcriptional regulator